MPRTPQNGAESPQEVRASQEAQDAVAPLYGYVRAHSGDPRRLYLLLQRLSKLHAATFDLLTRANHD